MKLEIGAAARDALRGRVESRMTHMHARSIRVCRIVTVPVTFATLLRRQVQVIAENGIDLTLVSSPGEELGAVARRLGLESHAIPMTRTVSPLEDLLALARMTRLFRAHEFDIVHSSTPKAGFLTAVAGRLAGVPIRLHTYTGQPWVGMTGILRAFSRWADRVIAILNTRLYADSRSQREFLIREGIAAAGKISVLAEGSLSGVDLRRFGAKRRGSGEANATRRELGIAPDAVVVVFAGRITRDKGVVELVEAFDRLAHPDKSVDLVMVGPFEPERDPLPAATHARLREDPRIHVVGFTPEPERFMATGDIFCLPSYREGFGSVVIEAAALGLPAVVTSIVGLVDAVVENVTGLLCPPKDVELLRDALQRLIDDPDLRAALGSAAAVRAHESFDARVVDQAVADEYKRIYNARRW